MKKISMSSFIFDLVDEYQIFSSNGSANSFTDEDLDSFFKKYKAESIKRDSALYAYINSTPNLFRCHIPYSKWTMSVAFDVVWYYDELIINDPILDLIKSANPDNERNKQNLQELLQYIITLRESIEGGYILFAGSDLIPCKTSQFQNISETLINDSTILDLFEAYTILARKPSPINNNSADDLTQILAQYEGMWGEYSILGMSIPPNVREKGFGNEMFFDFLTPYNYFNKSELAELGRQDLLEGLKKEYVKDISVVLESLTNAQRLNSPVMFFRDLDRKVAQCYALSTPSTNKKLIADTSVYDCSLPYMNDIPPERLFNTRNQMPEAFKEFRAFLYDIVKKTMTATDDPAEIRFKIDQEILSLQRKLEVEMKNAQRKWRFKGVAAPTAMVGLGTLGLYSTGINYPELMSTILGTGGAIRSLTTWSEVKSEKKKAEINPAFFLWKIQNKK